MGCKGEEVSFLMSKRTINKNTDPNSNTGINWTNSCFGGCEFRMPAAFHLGSQTAQSALKALRMARRICSSLSFQAVLPHPVSGSACWHHPGLGFPILCKDLSYQESLPLLQAVVPPNQSTVFQMPQEKCHTPQALGC